MYTEALQQLRAQRDRLNAAIAALEILDGPPAASDAGTIFKAALVKSRKKARRVKRQPKARRQAATPAPRMPPSELEPRILAALKTYGPLAPRELAEKLNASRYLLSRALEALEGRRDVLIIGKTTGCRVRLPGAEGRDL